MSKPIIFLLASGDTGPLARQLSKKFNDAVIWSFSTAANAVNALDRLSTAERGDFEAVVVEDGLPGEALVRKARELKGLFLSSYVYSASGYPARVPPRTDAVLTPGKEGLNLRPFRTPADDARLMTFDEFLTRAGPLTPN